MTSETRSELQRLVSALCDGQLTDAEHARLEELLQADAECRRLYLEYLDVHARLLVHPGLGQPDVGRAETGVPGERAPAGASSTEGSSRRWRSSQVLRYGFVAACTLAASLLVQLFLARPRAPDGNSPGPAPAVVEAPRASYVATLTQAVDSAWANVEAPRVGSRLAPGELRLQRGLARVRFDGGAELVIESPAVVRLDGPAAATVLRGQVVFKGNETASPFELRTPSSTLLDVGTEYAVAVGPEGDEVHVFDGAVQRLPREASDAPPEHVPAGKARRYGPEPDSPGEPTALDPARFIGRLANLAPPPADPAAGLLAYEGFAYADREAFRAGAADGGLGWRGSWRADFERPLNEGDQNRLVLNAREGLTRPSAAVSGVGGCFDYTGFTKYFRRLATPVRLDADGVYYLSFLFRRYGPPADAVNAVGVLLWTDADAQKQFRQEATDHRQRLNLGVGGTNDLFTHLQGSGARTSLPLSYGVTYLLVAKVVASGVNPDQVFLRVYGPDEPLERDEPGSWSLVGPPFRSDLAFDWLQVHVNSKTRQMLDEIRVGTTWASVTAAWAPAPAAGKPPRKEGR